MLSGRNPYTGERLITAQGSAGRRPTLGAGAHTRVANDGEHLFDVADAAAVLGVSHREVERMLDIGTTVALGALASPRATENGAASPDRPPVPPPAGEQERTASPVSPPARPPVWPPISPVTSPFAQPGGSYLVPLVEAAGSRWVRASELERCVHAREAGVTPGDLRAMGDGDDQIPLAEAARLVGLTKQYLRGLARYHDEHRAEIEQTLAAGRHPRRAFLVAYRGTKGQWLVKREDLAQFLERRRPPAVRVAYDLTLTTEKSLGVLALLGDTATRDAVLGAIQAGNDWAIDWLGDRAVGRIDGQPVPAEGLAVASFRHLTSRALDPFPHHHNVIINTARMPDGTHRGLWSRPLYANAQAASALATAEMRHRLTATLGVRWRPSRKGGWEIAGITNTVVREFSKRRNEIDEALQELEAEIGRGAHPNEVEHIVLRTRPAKNHTPADDLVASWRARAAKHGLDAEALDAVTGHEPHEQTIDTDAFFASLAGTEGICAGGSVFSRSEALAAMVGHPVPAVDGSEPQPLLCGAERLIQLTEEFLGSRHAVALTDAEEPLFTTVEMLAVQDRIAARFTKGLHRGAHLVADAHVDAALKRHSHLTGEQRRLVTEWCQRGHRFQTAIGRAGAGKTTTVAACADAWTATGHRVVGAAVKGEATRTLAAATGIECETVAWYLAHTDPQSLPLDWRTVLVVDEASTLSDRDLDALMDMAAVTGASLRLIGDPAQHGAIAAGGMFRVLCERHPTHTPELTTTHRLQDPHDRAAAQALREGRIDEAFDQLAAAGHLHVVADDLAMYRQVLGRWWDAHQDGRDHPMVDRRNSTRRQLNRLAHLLRRVNGELDGEAITASGNRAFAVGDRVTARAPNRELHVDGDRRAYVRNGALGTIVSVHHDRRSTDDDTLTVNFDGIGRIDIPRSFFDHHRTPAGRPEVGIDHAYALTSYAVQGSTRDVSTSRVDSTATRAETYVDITRGRHENHLYLTAASDPLDGEALPRVPAAPADLAVAERLHRSTGELTAWELANPADQPQPVPEQAVGI
ncbi:MAG: ATP-dependent RecD-like DNA helicase [Acidimicrobiales bacterium]|nr:ATP-dependent RecD-like DNA helicase [Acidimicrobiales bacterium]